MGATSNIEWTDATWTPIRARRADGKIGVHCEKVSPACKNCYAERFNKRNLPAHGTGLDFTVLNRANVEIIVDKNILVHPQKWRRPRRIFVCSQTDLFGQFVSDECIDQVFSVMAASRQHIFQVLTKRPERMQSYLSQFKPSPLKDGFITRGGVSHGESEKGWPIFNPTRWPLPNVWLGVTAENQEWASKRIPALLATPAAKRFVSCEPLLGSIDLNHSLGGTKWIGGQRGCGGTTKGIHHHDDRCGKGIDWVIVGGESGPGARPMHPEWARSLRDQCRAAGVPFFFKQWGEWSTTRNENSAYGEFHGPSDWIDSCLCKEGTATLYRNGNNLSGRELDGREWNEVPA